MLDNIKLKKGIDRDKQHYSFVGIERNKTTNELEFWLPIGFEDFPEDFHNVKSFFFKMYRTLNVYLKKRTDRVLIENEERDTNRDGFYEFPKGFGFTNEDNEEIILYSKINALDKVIEGYDELKIAALEKKHIRTTEIDYSKIHQYLHKAIYLKKNVVYVDEMNIAKNVIIQHSPPLIQLFCFIYSEIKREIGEYDTVPDRAFQLAEEYKDTFLQADTTLFGSEEMLNQTIEIMKDTLEKIELTTVYKDEDFWHFFDAIEAFLFSERNENEEGVYWGVSNFYDIWEDMCQTYFLEKHENTALFADIKGSLINLQHLTINPFELSLNREYKKRFLKPDLVLLDKIDYQGKKVLDLFYTKNPIEIGNFTNYGIFFRDFPNFVRNYPDLMEIYNKYLNLNTKYSETREDYYKNILGKHFKKFEAELLQTIYNYDPIELLRKRRFIYIPTFQIIDYKYMPETAYHEYNQFAIDKDGENKIKDDIKKQLIYEWSMQQNYEQSETVSEFWIPFYSENLDSEQIKKYVKVNNSAFNKSRIKLMKINFNILQDYYIKNSFYD